MVLSQQNSFMQPNNHYECGTSNKCSMCLYKLICEHSPFCCIKNISEGYDITPVVNEISKLEIVMLDKLSNIDTNINNLVAELNVLNNSISASINEINSKVDEILSKLNEANATFNNVPSVNAEILLENERGLVPFENNDDAVLVQKKNMFGKTKWVEEKKK